MPKNRIIVILGVLVALMPMLGFPRGWESILQVVIGLSIVLTSIWATIDKRLTLKAKAQKRHARRVREAELDSARQAELQPEILMTEETP